MMTRAQQIHSTAALPCDIRRHRVAHDTRPKMAIIERNRTPSDWLWRSLNASTLHRIRNAFIEETEDAYDIYSTEEFGAGSNKLVCDILEFSDIDVLVGTHGAGLTNMIFMRPGGVVVELVGEFDGRMTPVCGYHGPLAAVFGLHHYIYYYDSWTTSLDETALARDVARFIAFLRSSSPAPSRTHQKGTGKM